MESGLYDNGFMGGRFYWWLGQVVDSKLWRENLTDKNAQLAVLTQYNEMTWGNEVPTQLEQDTLLTNAGFSLPERKTIGGLFTLLTSKKL